MPDLFSHALGGYILLRPRWQAFLIPSIFMLGCIFPDMVRGPLLMITNLIKTAPEYSYPFLILHSPLPLLVQAWLVSWLFEKTIRRRVFLNLLAGIILHLVLDAGQKAYHISYLWYFPFSFENPINGLWWADDGFFVTAVFIMVAGSLFLIRRRHTPKR